MFRKGVSALIINKKQELLLVNLESFEPHFFAIPGGGIEEGESKEEAVYREIGEELGIEEKSLKLIGKSGTYSLCSLNIQMKYERLFIPPTLSKDLTVSFVK